MARQGLGGSLAYSYKGRRSIFRFRCGGVSHGIKIVFDESEARNRRAFYPHRLSTAQFSVVVLLNGYTEYRTFMTWMAAYADYLLDDERGTDALPVMTVAIPGKHFLRLGVPTTGIQFGDHVGSMLWEVPIVFESANDPIDKNPIPIISSYKNTVSNADQNVRYFYPFSEQLVGAQAPSVYDTVIEPSYVAISSPASLSVSSGSSDATDFMPAPSGRGAVSSWGD